MLIRTSHPFEALMRTCCTCTLTITKSSEPSATDHNLTLFADHMYSAYGIKHYHGGVEMTDYLAEVDAAAISVENHDTANETPESQRVAAAYQKLSELSNASTVAVSQPPTPRVTIKHQQWIASLIFQPLPRFDRDITNVFIHLFEDNVCGAFPIFRGFRITRDTPQHLYLAMAAVGGLYCATAGSLRMATWYIQNARRHLFTIVCQIILHRSEVLCFRQTQFLKQQHSGAVG